MPYFGQKMTSDRSCSLSFYPHNSTHKTLGAVVLLILLCVVCFFLVDPARADGGGPLPTNTPLPGAQSAPALLTSTPEVNTFNIIIDPNQNATVQPVTPENQAILSRSEALEAQAATPAQEEKFSSPLWVFGFFAIAIVILVLNSVSRGIRSRE